MESFPITPETREALAQEIEEKSQGLFLWVKLALDEITCEAHTDTDIREALREVPTEMNSFFQRILDNMSRTIKGTRVQLAKAILQYIVCSFRPLTTRELGSALKPRFGELFNIEYTVNALCPHLLVVNEDATIQPIHQTAREFISKDPPSDFAVNIPLANKDLALTCMHWLRDQRYLHDVLKSIKTVRCPAETLGRLQPFLAYAASFWYKHLEDATRDEALIESLGEFLDNSLLSWIELMGLLQEQHHLTQAARSLQILVERCSHVKTPHLKRVAQWAVDLIRIVPKFGRNISKYPSSIHKLLAPFCPSETAIGSRFGSNGSISVVGSSMTSWDDCLAHFTVGRNGEMCKAVAAGSKYLVVALSDREGTIITFSSETYQEVNRVRHGKRTACVALDATGERLVSSSLQSIQIWDIRSGRLEVELYRETSARCLSVGFRNENHMIVSVAADDTITTWNTRTHDCKTSRFKRPAPPKDEQRHRGAPWCVSLNEDCTKVALAYKGWPLEVWDVDEVRLITTVHVRNPVAAAFDPVRNFIYATGMDGTLIKFSINTGEYIEVSAQAYDISCNSDGSILATVNGEGCVELWSTEFLRLRHRLHKYDDLVIDLAFSPDGQKLYDVRSSECNVWAPDELIAPLHDEDTKSSTTPALTHRTPQSVSSLSCNGGEGFLCCAKDKGKIYIHETCEGREVQLLYQHASTVTIRALLWSAHRNLIASGDDSGRILVFNVVSCGEPAAPRWECTPRREFRLDSRVDQGLHQLLISDDGEKLLVSSNGSDRMFSLVDGSEVGQRRIRTARQNPSWIDHPNMSDRVIELSYTQARLFSWETFEELSGAHGIDLRRPSDSPSTRWLHRSEWLVNKAFSTRDGKFIISSVSPADAQVNSAYCSFWSADDFDVANGSAGEAVELGNMLVYSLVGVFENRAVFLDRDLYVCTTTAAGKAFDRHFYLPLDWLNAGEEHLATVNASGDFITAHHGEVGQSSLVIHSQQ